MKDSLIGYVVAWNRSEAAIGISAIAVDNTVYKLKEDAELVARAEMLKRSNMKHFILELHQCAEVSDVQV